MRDIPVAGYRQLADFRYQIRQFLHFSEEAARVHGVEPRQHQLLLALKGLPANTRPTVSTLATRLCLRHHSMVELIDRLAEHGAVIRKHGRADRREVLVYLTRQGEQLLRQLSVLHWEELQTTGPALASALRGVLEHT